MKKHTLSLFSLLACACSLNETQAFITVDFKRMHEEMDRMRQEMNRMFDAATRSAETLFKETGLSQSGLIEDISFEEGDADQPMLVKVRFADFDGDRELRYKYALDNSGRMLNLRASLERDEQDAQRGKSVSTSSYWWTLPARADFTRAVSDQYDEASRTVTIAIHKHPNAIRGSWKKVTVPGSKKDAPAAEKQQAPAQAPKEMAEAA